tara:strand:- start:389 stop:544 length:156 start_codon:yes stop_codon:yes gene_type:complete
MDRKNEVKRFDRAMTLILSILLFTALAMVFTACGTSKRVGGCGGSPIHLGN